MIKTPNQRLTRLVLREANFRAICWEAPQAELELSADDVPGRISGVLHG